MRRELLEGLGMRCVMEGWAVLVSVGLDFRGERTWVFLREPGMAPELRRTREEARCLAREYRRARASVGACVGVRDVRVVWADQVTKARGTERRCSDFC